MRTLDFLRTFADLSERQYGMFTAKQAARLGAERADLVRLTRAGVLHRVERGFYRFANVPADYWEEYRVAYLALFPDLLPDERHALGAAGGIICGESAAVLHGIGVYGLSRKEFIIEGAHKSNRRFTYLYQLPIEKSEWTYIDGLPVTNRLRTIADIVRTDGDLSILAVALGDLDRQQPVDVEYLSTKLDDVAHKDGFRSGREFVDYLLALAGRDGYGVLAEFSGRKNLGEALMNQLGSEMRSEAFEYAASPERLKSLAV